VLGGKVSKIMKAERAVAVRMLFATILILPFGIIGQGFQI
jgi:inner membrane transporter RhtA